MSFVKATRMVFLPCKFFGIHIVNLKNPKNDTHSKSLLFWKFNRIILMIATECIFLWTLFNFPLLTLKDLVDFGQYLTFMLCTWFLFYVTFCRSLSLKQLYIKFYDLSQNSFYSETNYHSVFVLCKFLTFITFLLQISRVYLLSQNLPYISLYQFLIVCVKFWIINIYNYTFFIIITYIFLLSLYLSKINKLLNQNLTHRKFLRALVEIYIKNCELAEYLNSIFDIFLLPALLNEFFWIMWIMYSKIYNLVEIGFISVNEIFDLIENIIISMNFMGIFLWVCSKTKNMVSVYSILLLFRLKPESVYHTNFAYHLLTIL